MTSPDGYLYSTQLDVDYVVGNDMACCHDPSVDDAGNDAWWADRSLHDLG